MKEYQVESTDGGQIIVYEYGNVSGREIVFLHGFATDHHVWFQQYTDDRLISSHRMICVDLRGHGQSLLPDSDFSNNDLWADDLASIFEQRNIKQPFIVAWSYGARVINDYLLKYGQKNIAGIVYIAAASFNEPTAVGPEHRVLAAMCSEEEAEDANRLFVEKIFGNILNCKNYFVIKEAVEKIPVSIKFKLRNRTLIYDDLFAGLEMPILAIHGKNDRFVFPELSEKIASTVTNGECLLFDSSGHAPFIDEPEKLNKELIDFFK